MHRYLLPPSGQPLVPSHGRIQRTSSPLPFLFNLARTHAHRYKASWPSCAASDCTYQATAALEYLRSGRYCADFDRPRPRVAMASTLPDSTSQLTSHLRQVSWV